MRHDRDWTDVMRELIRDAELTPPSGGWERLDAALRDAEAVPTGRRSEDGEVVAEGKVRRMDPGGGELAAEKGPRRGVRWRIALRSLGAAAAVLLLGIVAVDLWLRADRLAVDPTAADPMALRKHGTMSEEVRAEAGDEPLAMRIPSAQEGGRAEKAVVADRAASGAAPSDGRDGRAFGNRPSRRGSQTEPAIRQGHTRLLQGVGVREASAPAHDGVSSGSGAPEVSDLSGDAGLRGAAEVTERSAEAVAASGVDREPSGGSGRNRSGTEAGRRTDPATRSPRTAGDMDLREVLFAENRGRGADRKMSLALSASGNITGGRAIGAGAGMSLQSAVQQDPEAGVSSMIGNGSEITLLKGYDYNESSFRHHQPLSFALSLRKGVGRGFSVESGLNYTLLRSDVRALFAEREASQILHFIGIPVRVNWQFFEQGSLSLYLGAGGMAEKCVLAKLGTKRLSEPGVQWSVAGAAGVQYRLGGLVGLYFEPEAVYSLTQTRLRTSRTENPLSLTLRLGVRFLF